ncbi:GNAT family N-acetyltransferase [Devosia sp. PTR5]|uniref:GNAT family N-acetyltransferase n=1 Tax=Devosia oryzisoli TaxID=2774138 RepID=A0A927IS10_9HYPH|nr:GNAT family N-acetyltransferase [Devosia oryzisoli]MBD8064352.1 GNAT family N-acetyltransferase [Devosia oryzisoli]
MMISDAESVPLIGAEVPRAAGAAVKSQSTLSVTVTSDIDAVAPIWSNLTQSGIESPGQSFGFIRHWIADRTIPVNDQRYVVGFAEGNPIALLPLHRQARRGLSMFTWFPGTQVGCNAPIVDQSALASLPTQDRCRLWKGMTAELDADLLYLPFIPEKCDGQSGLFGELGTREPADILYRSVFSCWEECDREQRSRSRRKHDRQQGDKLAALGSVHFEEVGDPADVHLALDVMFRQRTARFKAQGIRDVFVEDRLIDFYHKLAEPASQVDVRLHVMRLENEIVAVRYNIVDGDRMFCLISSMSDDPTIQSGSPGKQCLLRVMQTVFESGYTMFDMGAGITDEKRHWCNVQLPLNHHYVGLSLKGRAAAAAHRRYQNVRAWAKANPQVKKTVRSFAHWRDRKSAQPVTDSDQL